MISCSQACRDVGEPLAGTAPKAHAWLLVEHPGPWPSQALQASGIAPQTATAWESWSGLGLRVLLIRHPDRPLRSDDGRRNIWLAHPASRQILHANLDVADIPGLTGLDAASIVHGELASFTGDPADSMVLVCSHGARDSCCAVEGRPVLRESLSAIPDRFRVWECSHIGGHRFAPVALSLPQGLVIGRATSHSVLAALDGRVDYSTMRGRSHLPPWAQVAEATAAHLAGDLDLSKVTCEEQGDGLVRVHVDDGRSWLLRLRSVPIAARPDSCGKPAFVSDCLVADLVS